MENMRLVKRKRNSSVSEETQSKKRPFILCVVCKSVNCDDCLTLSDSEPENENENSTFLDESKERKILIMNLWKKI